MKNLTLPILHEVITSLALSPSSLEDKLVAALLSYFPTERSLRNISTITDEELIVSLWDVSSPEEISDKRKQLISAKSLINKKLYYLMGQNENPHRIILGKDNIFIFSDQPKSLFPPGHFYSPVVNPDNIKKHEDRIWTSSPPEILGIDFNKKSHLAILEKDFPTYLDDFNYPDHQKETSNPYDFFLKNGLFEGLDARTLFVMLRKFRPQNMIEIGSGFSSLLTAHINRTWLKNKINFTCIEPFPREFLTKDVPGLSSLIVSKVEDVDMSVFEQLKAGDILFIDSSHVSKTGSDVNFLFFEILPKLKKDVFIHIHDIFLPYEYPPKWVLDENRSWNEQYLLRALLMYSPLFEVMFSCAYAYYNLPELTQNACSGILYDGASFWIKKIA
jgi:hypothetical protein